MKKPVFNFLLLATFTPFLIQCASQTDVDELRYQLRIVNKKLEDMKSTTVGQLQKRQAAASGQVDQVEQDILELKSQLEETYYLNQRLREQNKELEESISNVALEEAIKRQEALQQLEETQREKEAKFTSELNEKFRLQQESVKAIQEARIKDAERRAKETALAAELAKTRSGSASADLLAAGNVKHILAKRKKIKHSVVAPAKKPISTVSKQSEKISPAGSSTPKAQKSTAAPSLAIEQPGDDLKKAKKMFDNNDYSGALLLYEQVASNPSAANAVDARFMMGECLFNQKQYDKAIMQYQKIISQHSNNSNAPTAMLKQGMAFEKLADKDTAKVIYKKLLKRHAASPEAAIAQDKLAKL